MKSTSKLIIFIFTLLALAASAYAQSSREELQPMVEQCGLDYSYNSSSGERRAARLNCVTVKPKF